MNFRSFEVDLPDPAGVDLCEREALNLARLGCWSSFLIIKSACDLRAMNFFRDCFGRDLDRTIVLMTAWLGHIAASAEDSLARRARYELSALPGSRGAHGWKSIRTIAGFCGIPRETVRRHMHALEQSEWVFIGGREWSINLRRLDDLVMSVGWRLSAGDIIWSEELYQRAEDCQGDGIEMSDVLASAHATAYEMLSPALASEMENLGRMAGWAVAVPMILGYWLRLLLRLREAFCGDLDLVLMLGEISHSNMKMIKLGMVNSFVEYMGALHKMKENESPGGEVLCSSNSHSLALCLNIPAESARRKLDRLQGRGWVTRAENRRYFVTPQLIVDHESTIKIGLAELERMACILRSHFAQPRLHN